MGGGGRKAVGLIDTPIDNIFHRTKRAIQMLKERSEKSHILISLTKREKGERKLMVTRAKKKKHLFKTKMNLWSFFFGLFFFFNSTSYQHRHTSIFTWSILTPLDGWGSCLLAGPRRATVTFPVLLLLLWKI